MAVIGLIPARGGSKGIPGKNIAPCAGRPLLAWTCDAALGCKALDRVILSTDDPAIADVGRRYGVEVPFMRPAQLAADATPMVPVMAHALEWAEATGESVEAIVLLQPTSPLRRAEHIAGAIELFRRTKAATVVSIVEVPHRYHPQSVLRMRDDALIPYLDGTETVSQRQDLAPVYARNGPALLVCSAETIRSGKLYGKKTVGFLMTEQDSLDVDAPADLRLAELLLANKPKSST